VSNIIDPDSFRQFEHSGWQNIPRQYHQAFGELTAQSIEPLLDAAGVKKGTKVIDIATGPGYVAAAAARRGATVIGVDFSTAMIEEAKRHYPDIEFREGNAEQLLFGNNLFDAAVMNFGVLHLDKPDQALAEACRVLRTGGRFGFTAWAKPEEAVGFGIVLRSLAKYGDVNVSLPEGPPFFRFSEPDECMRSLLVAGFAAPQVVKVRQFWRLPSLDSLFECMRDSTVRTAGLLRAQKPDVLEKIRGAMLEEVKNHQTANVVELPMPAILASGTKA
jgi:ubiquinone/menaquinone biosynthesis C-methylase UbiE